MSLKKTLVLSMFFHLCLFAATLLFSEDLLGGSSKTPEENIFFVRLTEDTSIHDGGFVTKTERPGSKGSRMIKLQKKAFSDIHDKPVLIEAETQPSNNILSEDYKGNVEKSIHILSGDERDSQGISFILNTGVAGGKGRTILSAGIIEAIRSSIERAKTYPLLARKRGIEGTVYISFRVSPQGQPEDIKILRSSGSSILDTATLELLRRAAPFPYVDSLIEVPIVYRLE
jgi:TonB family protein